MLNISSYRLRINKKRSKAEQEHNKSRFYGFKNHLTVFFEIHEFSYNKISQKNISTLQTLNKKMININMDVNLLNIFLTKKKIKKMKI